MKFQKNESDQEFNSGTLVPLSWNWNSERVTITFKSGLIMGIVHKNSNMLFEKNVVLLYVLL